eukprot:5032836-Prymnesium_polylepis.1
MCLACDALSSEDRTAPPPCRANRAHVRRGSGSRLYFSPRVPAPAPLPRTGYERNLQIAKNAISGGQADV